MTLNEGMELLRKKGLSRAANWLFKMKMDAKDLLSYSPDNLLRFAGVGAKTHKQLLQVQELLRQELSKHEIHIKSIRDNDTLGYMWELNNKLAAGFPLMSHERKWYNRNLAFIQEYYQNKADYWATKISLP